VIDSLWLIGSVSPVLHRRLHPRSPSHGLPRRSSFPLSGTTWLRPPWRLFSSGDRRCVVGSQTCQAAARSGTATHKPSDSERFRWKWPIRSHTTMERVTRLAGQVLARRARERRRRRRLPFTAVPADRASRRSRRDGERGTDTCPFTGHYGLAGVTTAPARSSVGKRRRSATPHTSSPVSTGPGARNTVLDCRYSRGRRPVDYHPEE
jgi:hypothetical protein